MTVLVLFDCKTRELRRYDSTRPHGITHETDPIGEDHDLAAIIRAVIANPSSALYTEKHEAWLRYGSHAPLKPWRPER